MYRIGRSRRDRDASFDGGNGGILPLRYGHSNPQPLSGWETVSDGQFDWGGRLLKVTEAPKGSLRMVGNHSKSVKAEGSLTARATTRAGTKVGLSDPVVPHGRAIAQRIKATLGITGLSPQESTSTGRFGTSMSARRILGL